MFTSPKTFKKAGFDVIQRPSVKSLMVARHPSIKNYLFKKHKSSVSNHDQLINYLTRIAGARAVDDFIAANNLQFIITPTKWLYPLPQQFIDPFTLERSYILIVEELDIYSGGKKKNDQLAKKYRQIDERALEELCFVVFHFRGLDSRLHNVPITREGKIAFIDTECWEEKDREGFMQYIIPFLSDGQKKCVLSTHDKLVKESKK